MFYKTKKLLVKSLLIIFAFFACITVSKATDANSYGSWDESSNTGGGCTIANAACSIQNAHRIRVRLIYYDGKNEELIAGPTEVAPDQWGWYTTGETYSFNSDKFEESVVGNNNDSKQKKREKLQKFVNMIGWGVDLNSLNKTSCEVDRKGNCYGKAGYRVIAELYIGLSAYAGEGVGSNYVSVKDPINANNGTYLDVPSRNSYRGSNMSNKMSIRWADINYTCNGGGKKTCNFNNESLSCLTDKNCGYGIWIVDISSAIKNNPDYSLDMACENCDSKNEDSKSMVIQDTTNWEDIKNSSSISDDEMKCSVNVKDYYQKTKDRTYCREEYHVYYPTYNKTTGKLKVNSGRYFTVNPTDKELELIEENILNFAPIKVTKIRQCKGGNLDSFNRNSESSFKCSTGDILIDYKETKSGGYSYNGKLKPYNCSFDSSNNNGTLTQSYTCSYTLDDGVYQFVRVKDGYSIQNKNDRKNNEVYKNLKVSNLPISLKQDLDEGKTIASVKFQYNLPTCDNNSKISKLYDGGGKCLNKNSSTNSDGNIYKKYDENKEITNDSINNTACVKLYGTSGLGDASKKSDVWRCIKAREKDKFGNCIKQNNLSDTSSNYVCDITEDLCTKENAKSVYKVDWNPEANDGKGMCCPRGSVYVKGKGCQDKPTPICVGSDCKPEPACVEDGNMSTCQEGYTCNEDTKKCVPPTKDKCNQLGCSDACCESPTGSAYCGVKINGNVVCPGKPTPLSDNLVYRTIDPTSPFTYQNGSVRKTGDIWCDNSLTSNSSNNCSGDLSSSNNVVKTVITDNASRSEENAMYKVKLDSSTISSIRNYNKSHNYNDFTLSCDKNNNCKIKGFKDGTSINIEGKCAISSGSSYDTCGKVN